MSDTPTTNPAPELYPGHAADQQRQAGRAREIARATAAVLPGPLADAFAGAPTVIAGLTVRPLVHYDFVLLRKLGSPLLKQLDAAVTGEARTPITDEQGYEIIWQFTRPIREVIAAVALGPEKFRERAITDIGLTLGPIEVALLVKAVEAEFLRSFATKLKYGSPPAESEGTVFTPPPAPAATTASAGGSITSAS